MLSRIKRESEKEREWASKVREDFIGRKRGHERDLERMWRRKIARERGKQGRHLER